MMTESDAAMNDENAFAEAERLERQGRREQARSIREQVLERQRRDADRRDAAQVRR